MVKKANMDIKILENNPAHCLDAKRALNKCYICKYYKVCNSRIVNLEKDAEIKELTKQADYYHQKLEIVKDKLKEVLK